MIRLVNAMIARAVEMQASDIHIEAAEAGSRVRYRIDGLLRDVEPAATRLKAAVVPRVKIMARLNIAERRLAQDGRIRQVVRGQEIDLRVSTVPAIYGRAWYCASSKAARWHSISRRSASTPPPSRYRSVS